MRTKLHRLSRPELDSIKERCNFTEDELLLVEFMRNDRSYEQIADKLCCSTATVGRKIRAIKDKIEGGYHNMEKDRNDNEMPKFSGKNVPIQEAAKLMGKDQQFIRQGLIRGLLPIGVAFKKTVVDQKWGTKRESEQYDYYISPKLLYEYTGVVYEENK
jgi:hypothetical protein